MGEERGAAVVLPPLVSVKRNFGRLKKVKEFENVVIRSQQILLEVRTGNSF